MTARNLRILQIGIVLAVCLALVLAAVLGGNCAANNAARNAAQQETAHGFHASALQNAFTAAGFYAYGNLYEYTLIPKGNDTGSCKVELFTADALNDTVTVRFSAVRALAGSDAGALADAYADKLDQMRAWQVLLVDALLAAMSDMDARTPQDMSDGVLLSLDDGKAYAGKSDAFSVEGGYTDAEDPNVYILTVRVLPAE